MSMCGRFCIAASPGDLSEYYQTQIPESYNPGYNIAPSELVLTIILSDFGYSAVMGTFGFSIGIKNRVINARAETISEKPLFKNLAESGRCLIPASGYYEWQHEGKRRLPWFIYLPSKPIISFAGLIRSLDDKSESICHSGFCPFCPSFSWQYSGYKTCFPRAVGTILRPPSNSSSSSLPKKSRSRKTASAATSEWG